MIGIMAELSWSYSHIRTVYLEYLHKLNFQDKTPRDFYIWNLWGSVIPEVELYLTD